MITGTGTLTGSLTDLTSLLRKDLSRDVNVTKLVGGARGRLGWVK